MTAIEIRGISKRFAQVVACDEVNLQIAPGERLVFLGPSGAGKTTLLRIIAGLQSPDTGSILVEGKEVSKLAPASRNMAFVSQDYALYPQLSVEQNLCAALAPSRLEFAKRNQRVSEVLRWFEIDSLRSQLPAHLSGGQAQRVALARAIVRRPAFLLLDEPLSQVDCALRQESRALILKLSQEFDTTIMMVTHDPLDAMQLATRIATIDRGRVHQVAPPVEIYERPRTKLSAELLSPFGMNWLTPAQLASKDVDFPGEIPAHSLLGLRPERLCVFQAEAREPQASIRACVTSIQPLGFANLLMATTAGFSLKILDPHCKIALGPTAFSVAIDKCIWLDAEDRILAR